MFPFTFLILPFIFSFLVFPVILFLSSPPLSFFHTSVFCLPLLVILCYLSYILPLPPLCCPLSSLYLSFPLFLFGFLLLPLLSPPVCVPPQPSLFSPFCFSSMSCIICSQSSSIPPFPPSSFSFPTFPFPFVYYYFLILFLLSISDPLLTISFPSLFSFLFISVSPLFSPSSHFSLLSSLSPSFIFLSSLSSFLIPVVSQSVSMCFSSVCVSKQQLNKHSHTHVHTQTIHKPHSCLVAFRNPLLSSSPSI